MILLAVSAGFAFVVSILVSPIIIKWSSRRQMGQPIREEGPKAHIVKAGIPTLGGIAIVIAAICGYGLSHIVERGIRTRAAPLALLVVAGFGLVGFLDDYLKLKRRHNEGLKKHTKFLMQILVGLLFGILALYWAKEPTIVSFTRYNVPEIKLNSVLYILWCIAVIVASSNAVNLTDGLDGLAAGASSFVFAGFAIIGYFEFRHPGVYHVVPALDLAVVAAGLTGACLGFLWWNALPAKIIMGDTGALALGGGLAALAIEEYNVLLLPVLAGLFVVVTLSVIIQVFSFKLFKKRVFKMAPLHHHFELSGWPESTVIIRFWILSSIFTTLGLGLFFGYYIGLGYGR
jgi:phospho-N-acetylmuramoyl-pentapeptide-transferase